MPFLYPLEMRTAAVELVRSGKRPVDVAAELGVSWTSVYAWLHAVAPELVARPERCFRCGPTPSTPADPEAYAYVLGLYLGDGWIHRTRRGVWYLSVFCADAWPGLIDAAAEAMHIVSGRSSCRLARHGCHEVKAYWNHWPCLFPQHGSGRKHDRPMVLSHWQADIVSDHPGPLLRGLFHSDGWRGMNVAVKHPPGQVVRYRYPRYEFTNKSEDIRRICTDALDSLAIAWRPVGPWRIAVSRREAVAALDEHVGPKY